jgi:hypothetical protein
MPNPLTDSGTPFSNYTYYYELTVPACVANDEISYTFDNLCPTPGLKSWGYVRDDLNDLRIGYWNGTAWSDIARCVAGSTVIFPAQISHACETVGPYCIVIGHASEATRPPTYTPVQASETDCTSDGTSADAHTISRHTATRETAKRHRVTAESRVLDSSVTTHDDSTNCYGVADTTGQQVAARFTPSVTSDYQFFELLLRRHSTYATETDCYIEIWSDAAGSPGSVIGRAVSWVYGIETSSHAFQWLPFYVPSKLTLTAGTDYWCVFSMPSENGGSARGADWAHGTVASGGTCAIRTRSDSAWGPWSRDATKRPCLKVWRGWPGLPSRRTAWNSRHASPLIAESTGLPWASVFPHSDLAVAIASQIYKTGASDYRALFNCYTSDSHGAPGTFGQTNPPPATGSYVGKLQIGVAEGTSLTGLIIRRQDPLLSLPTTPSIPGGIAYTSSPYIYDWRLNNYKMYYRDSSTNADSNGCVRRLRHATNTQANWYQPSTSSGWTDDGVVTMPCPIISNVFDPKAWIDDGITYVQFNCYNSAASKARCMLAEKDCTTSLRNLKPIYVDLTDLVPVASPSATGDLYFVNVGSHYRASDGVWHNPVTLQRYLTGDPNGHYYYDVWMQESLDGYVFAPPYPLVLRNASNAGEELGCYAGGFVDDTNFFTQRISKYYTGDDVTYDASTRRWSGYHYRADTGLWKLSTRIGAPIGASQLTGTRP